MYDILLIFGKFLTWKEQIAYTRELIRLQRDSAFLLRVFYNWDLTILEKLRGSLLFTP